MLTAKTCKMLAADLSAISKGEIWGYMLGWPEHI